jgi:hypothetical protein
MLKKIHIILIVLTENIIFTFYLNTLLSVQYRNAYVFNTEGFLENTGFLFPCRKGENCILMVDAVFNYPVFCFCGNVPWKSNCVQRFVTKGTNKALLLNQIARSKWRMVRWIVESMKHLPTGLPHPAFSGLRLSYTLRAITGDRHGRLFLGECKCTSVEERETSIFFNEDVIPYLRQRRWGKNGLWILSTSRVILTVEIRSIWRRTWPLSLCSPQNPRGLNWQWTPAFAVADRQLKASAIVWPTADSHSILSSAVRSDKIQRSALCAVHVGCVCVLVCVHVCMYLCTYVCACVCMYVRMYVCMHICTYVRMYILCTYVYVCMYVCMHVRTYVCMYVCVYVCMYVCMCVCMYVRVYMYVCMHAFMYLCEYEWMYVCIYERVYIRMYVCTYVWIYVCMYYICMCVCMCVCVCVYVCMYAFMWVWSNVCMYVLVWTCVWIYMYVCVWMYVCIHACKHACIYVWTNTCTYVFMYACIYVSMNECMNVRVYECIYVCVYVCMCVGMCMYVCIYLCEYERMYVYMHVCMY